MQLRNVTQKVSTVTNQTSSSTDFIAPRNVDEFLARFPGLIPGYVSRRAPNATSEEQAELVARLEQHLRTPPRLKDCPDRIAMFGLAPVTGEPMQRFFRWVSRSLNASGVIPLPTTLDAAYLQTLEADGALTEQRSAEVTR